MTDEMEDVILDEDVLDSDEVASIISGVREEEEEEAVKVRLTDV